MNKKEQQETSRETHRTLCWSCRNAVPKMVNGKYIRGCSWSTKFEPVKGWTAEKSIKNPKSANRIETWCVLECPEYKADRPEDVAFNHGCDEAYVEIAERVLKLQMDRYRSALKQYAETGYEKYLCRIKSIERELLSPYYAALPLGEVDYKELILQCRKEAGVALGG